MICCAAATLGTRQPTNNVATAATQCPRWRATRRKASALTRSSNYAGIIEACPGCRVASDPLFVPARAMALPRTGGGLRLGNRACCELANPPGHGRGAGHAGKRADRRANGTRRPLGVSRHADRRVSRGWRLNHDDRGPGRGGNIKKTFPRPPPSSKSRPTPREKTAVLSLLVPDLLPHSGNARISYILGYKSKKTYSGQYLVG